MRDDCCEFSGSAAHLEGHQFKMRSNEEVRLKVGERRKRKQEYSPSNQLSD